MEKPQLTLFQLKLKLYQTRTKSSFMATIRWMDGAAARTQGGMPTSTISTCIMLDRLLRLLFVVLRCLVVRLYDLLLLIEHGRFIIVAHLFPIGIDIMIKLTYIVQTIANVQKVRKLRRIQVFFLLSLFAIQMKSKLHS